MNKTELNTFNYPVEKSKQQERAISQLQKIVASMIKRMPALENTIREIRYILT